MSYNHILAYSNGNVGDDLFIYILCKRYPNHKFLIETENKKQLCNLNLNNLIITRKTNWLFDLERKLFSTSILKKLYLKRLGNLNCYIQIGGSLFIQHDNWKKYFDVLGQSINQSKPYFLIGCNFGPFYSADYIDVHKKRFKKYTDVCFRDKYSYDLFSQNSNSRYAHDIAFALQNNNNIVKEKIVTISLIELKNREDLSIYRQQYIDKIIQIIEHYAKKDYKIYLIAFCIPEGDKVIIDEIKQNTEHSVDTILYHDNLQEILNHISKTEIMIATRFHAAILGFIYKAKVLPLIYSKKTSDMLKCIGYDNLSIDIKNIDKLRMQQLNNIKQFDYSSSNAQLQFKKLDSYLN